MATSSNGPLGNHNGKIGNIVYYTLNNKQVSRVIGKNTKPRTVGQLRQQEVMKICGEFFKTLKEFTTIGFSTEIIGTTKNQFNLVMENNSKYIIKGDYPALSIAYEKVILSKGKLKAAVNPKVEKSAEGLHFSWDGDPQMSWPESTDQTMILVYFPETKEVICKLFGNSRISGSELLEIPEPLLARHMETYISFISADRKRISDSIYTGNVNL